MGLCICSNIDDLPDMSSDTSHTSMVDNISELTQLSEKNSFIYKEKAENQVRHVRKRFAYLELMAQIEESCRRVFPNDITFLITDMLYLRNAYFRKEKYQFFLKTPSCYRGFEYAHSVDGTDHCSTGENLFKDQSPQFYGEFILQEDGNLLDAPTTSFSYLDSHRSFDYSIMSEASLPPLAPSEELEDELRAPSLTQEGGWPEESLNISLEAPRLDELCSLLELSARDVAEMPAGNPPFNFDPSREQPRRLSSFLSPVSAAASFDRRPSPGRLHASVEHSSVGDITPVPGSARSSFSMDMPFIHNASELEWKLSTTVNFDNEPDWDVVFTVKESGELTNQRLHFREVFCVEDGVMLPEVSVNRLASAPSFHKCISFKSPRRRENPRMAKLRTKIDAINLSVYERKDDRLPSIGIPTPSRTPNMDSSDLLLLPSSFEDMELSR